MLIINTKPLEQGVYKVLKSNHITEPPQGWAYVPEDFVKPSTYPRLGSLEVEEIAYPYEVEVEQEVTKYRDVEVIGEDGETVIIQEEYTEKEIVVETREKVMLTVVGMTEGTLPEPVEPEPTQEELQWQAITDLEIQILELKGE